MLKIQIEKSDQVKQKAGVINPTDLTIDGYTSAVTTDDEGGKIINDTSDSDGHIGNIEEDSEDPYQKIKLQANLAMRNLVKNNNHAIYNYWIFIFPSFMIRPQSELTKYLWENQNKNEVDSLKSFRE